MNAPVELPAEIEVLSGDPSAALGNLVLRQADPPRILKLYRLRRSKARDALSLFSGVFLERKRPVSAEGRCETERDTIGLWQREGYRVPAVYEEPIPDWAGGHPALWLEDVSGQPLLWALADGELPFEQRLAWVAEIAASTRRRLRRALELEEVLLIQEHPTLKHVLVHAPHDLVWIDLENGFRPGYPLLYAIAYELAGLVRSLPPVPGREDFERTFLEAFDDDELIRAACRDYYRWTPVRTARRWSDRARRDRSKTATVDRLAAHVGLVPPEPR